MRSPKGRQNCTLGMNKFWQEHLFGLERSRQRVTITLARKDFA